ncbi:hypothetical protein BGZ65_012639, partial [Modicella reniformis]
MIQIRTLTSAPHSVKEPSAPRSVEERSVEEPSANYRPGKEGFAPGMPHPPGSSASPPPPPTPRTVDSIPPMSKKHEVKVKGSPNQRFKLEMTKLRHNYQREHLIQEQSKREEIQWQRGGALRKLQARQARDREENQGRLSFEQLMQPNEGMTITGPERQAQVMEFVNQRRIKRQENYRLAEERLSEERMDAMIRLFHAAGDFVTMENLDAKVHEFYEAGMTMQNKVYVLDVQDMVADV